MKERGSKSRAGLASGFLALCLSSSLLVPDATRDPCANPSDPDIRFQRLSADFLADYLAAHPVRATQLGIHDHDSQLPNLSQKGIKRRVRDLANWLEAMAEIDGASLSGDAFFDYRILDHAIRAELLELEEIRGWKHNPMLYGRIIADGLASLLDRRFSTLEIRLGDLIARLQGLSKVIRAAKSNLEDVPALWVEIGLANARGTVSFLRTNVPAALQAQGLDTVDPGLVEQWRGAHERALRRLEEFVEWLARDLQPRALGDFRLGRDLFERKLRYEEHVSLTVDELAEINERAIRDYREWVARETARVDPALPPAEVMRRVTLDHPAPDEVIPTARRNVEQARQLVLDRQLLTLPTEELPIVRPSPDYARSGFASMSTPGPFETEATRAYYNITTVDPSWTPEQQEQHLTYFNHPGLLGISVHEAMPGHFVQLLYQRELPTDIRKVFVPRSFVEGWAHYAEQMMVDEGLGGPDPAVRLAQLRRALQRHARWHAGLALHVSDDTLAEVAERFAEIAYFAPFPALRETRRATYEPTYLYYALGRMQILELREDYRRHQESRGETFDLQEFHDRLLKLGLPLTLAREVLIPTEETAGGRMSE